MATGGHLKKITFTKKVVQVIWTMFEPTAGWLQLDINSLLVIIYLKHDGTVPTCFNQSKASISFDYIA